MTLKNTIKKMLIEYPTLFQDRAQCLNQLFCVNGNGLDWINGQLADKHPVISKREKAQSEKRHAENDELIKNSFDCMFDEIEIDKRSGRLLAEPMSNYIQLRLYDLYRQQRAKENLDKIIQPGFHNFIRKNYEFYPLCEYAHITNLPADIKPDWLEGAKETLQLLNQYGTDPAYKDSTELIKKLNKDKRLK